MELVTLHMDTYKVVKLLREKGYTKEEAEGFIEAIQEITLSGVATKQDIVDVKNEIQDLRNEIHKFKSDMIKFQLIQTITIIGVMIALFQVF